MGKGEDNNGLIQVVSGGALGALGWREYDNSLRELNCRMELLASRDLPDFMNRIQIIVNRLGFSDFSFTRLAGSSDPDAHMSTAHRMIKDHYKDFSVWTNDMMIGHARNSISARFQSDIDRYVISSPVDTDAILTNKATIEIRARLGYHDFYGIPLPARNCNGNILMAITSLDMPSPEFKRNINKNRQSLHTLAGAVDHVGIKKFPQFFLAENESDVITLNPKPLELLTKMAAENKKLKECAAEMGISESTANDHMAAAKKALGARTSAAAVYLAIKSGLIDYRQ